MATIRMTKTAAGPEGTFVEGRTYEVDGEIGSGFVSAGAAEWVGRRPERAVRSAPETRGGDLSAMSKSELVALAEERGVEVEREDGEGAPLKSDYVRALGA